MTVYGPYGMFGAKYLQAQQPMIWIAGGIGITPFLSMLQFETTRKGAPSQPICFIWAVTDEQDAVYLDEITALQQCIPHLEFHLHISSIKGRLTSKTLQELLGDVRLRESMIFMCEPIPMMRSLTIQLTTHNISRSKIITEESALR
jgi:predicted ferric reductase